MTLILNETEVRRLLPMVDLVSAMERVLKQFSTGQGIVQPLRSVLSVGAEQAYYGVMPASLTDPPALGVKLVTNYRSNQMRNLPSHLATIVLLDPETGALTAILDGRYITEARTAAVSAVAARHLARSTGDPSKLAIIGTGAQARSHLTAFTETLSIGKVHIWSPSTAHREQFASQMTLQTKQTVQAVADAEAAVREADLVVLATSSTEPVIQDSWVAAGAHVTSVGAPEPHLREMDPALVTRSRLIVDSRAGAFAESGDIVLGLAEGKFDESHVAGEIGEVIAGHLPGRTSETQITIFKSLGMAAEDMAAAQLAYSRALLDGSGQKVLV